MATGALYGMLSTGMALWNYWGICTSGALLKYGLSDLHPYCNHWLLSTFISAALTLLAGSATFLVIRYRGRRWLPQATAQLN